MNSSTRKKDQIGITINFTNLCKSLSFLEKVEFREPAVVLSCFTEFVEQYLVKLNFENLKIKIKICF